MNATDIFKRQLLAHDAKLKAHAPMRRWNSFADCGIAWGAIKIDPTAPRLIEEYRKMFKKLVSKFKAPRIARGTYGFMVNADEAIDGIPECFRRWRVTQEAPFRIGINMSAASVSTEVQVLRGAVILAVWDALHAEGRRVHIDVIYGNGKTTNSWCHARVSIPKPTRELILAVCCSANNAMMKKMLARCVAPLASNHLPIGAYRIYEWPFLAQPYDLVFDRVETSGVEVEKARVLKRLAELKIL